MDQDHGYHLGEQNEWSKKEITDLGTHVPLLIRVPWAAASIGARTTVKAELVDMYRTLADLANMQHLVEPGVQGASLRRVFDNPQHPPSELADKIAYSQIGRAGCESRLCSETDRLHHV